MLRFLIFAICLWRANGYFTLPGKCPSHVGVKNISLVGVQDSFKLEDFYGEWHQVYHYSSDSQQRNNCSKVELTSKQGMVYFNVSRVDHGLFHRYSVAKVHPPRSGDEEDLLRLEFEFENDARRVKTRKYEVHVLATNYNFFATLYTCQYSQLIDKHFIYVWILSRRPVLNDVSKHLALQKLENIGLSEKDFVKDDLSKCHPKYYDDVQTKPLCFNYPVPLF